MDVDREKVFGVVYGDQKAARPRCPSAGLLLPNGDALELKSLEWAGESFTAELVAGAKVAIPVEKLVSLDFSLGKVQYLSDIKPRNAQSWNCRFSLVDEPISDIDRDYHQFKDEQNLRRQAFAVGRQNALRPRPMHSSQNRVDLSAQ